MPPETEIPTMLSSSCVTVTLLIIVKQIIEVIIATGALGGSQNPQNRNLSLFRMGGRAGAGQMG